MSTAQYDELSPPLVEQVKEQPELAGRDDLVGQGQRHAPSLHWTTTQ
jgi:hypothetical protein